MIYVASCVDRDGDALVLDVHNFRWVSDVDAPILLDAYPRGVAELKCIPANSAETISRENAILLAWRAKVGVRPQTVA